MTDKPSNSSAESVSPEEKRHEKIENSYTRLFGVFDETDVLIFFTILSVSVGIGFIISTFSGPVGGIIASFGIFVILLKESLQSSDEAIPPVHFTIPLRFNSFVPRVLFSGQHFLWPLIEKVKSEYLYHLKLQTLDLEVPVTTSGYQTQEDSVDDGDAEEELSAIDKAQKRLREKRQELVIVLKITVRYIVDPTITDDRGIPTFVKVASDNPQQKQTSRDFDEGLASKIKSELGRFGGLHWYMAFINKRRGIEHYLNSILRLRKPPHVDPLEMLGDFIEDNEETRNRLKSFGWDPDEDSIEIPMEHRLEFYEEFSDAIGNLLRSEHDVNDHSTIEKRYGVDLIESTIDEVDYDEKSKQAIQAEMQTIKELEGRAHYEEQLLALIEKLEEKGLSPEDASATAQVILGLSESKTFNVSGLPDSIGSLLGDS